MIIANKVSLYLTVIVKVVSYVVIEWCINV